MGQFWQAPKHLRHFALRESEKRRWLPASLSGHPPCEVAFSDVGPLQRFSITAWKTVRPWTGCGPRRPPSLRGCMQRYELVISPNRTDVKAIQLKHAIVLLFAAAAVIAADATGRWTGTLAVTASDGSERSAPAHLVLKQEGSTLTGTAGGDANDQQPIRGGKAENGNLSFEVRGMKFALKHEGEQITGEVTHQRNGLPHGQVGGQA